MDDFLRDLEIIEGNLSAQYEKELASCEIKAAYLDDAAALIASLYTDEEDFFGNSDMINAYKEVSDRIFRMSYGSLSPYTEKYVKNSIGALYREDGFRLAAEVFRRINERSPIAPESFFEEGESPLEPGELCYIENPMTKKVFSRISLTVKGLRVKLGRDFEGLCDSVSSGRSEYCLLPIESNGGELMNFSRLISEHGLKKCLTVSYIDDDSFTRFALLKKNVLPLVRKGGEKLTLEAVIAFESGEEMGGFVSSLETLGAQVLKIRPAEGSYYGGEANRYRISLALSEKELSLLLFCLF